MINSSILFSTTVYSFQFTGILSARLWLKRYSKNADKHRGTPFSIK